MQGIRYPGARGRQASRQVPESGHQSSKVLLHCLRVMFRACGHAPRQAGRSSSAEGEAGGPALLRCPLLTRSRTQPLRHTAGVEACGPEVPGLCRQIDALGLRSCAMRTFAFEAMTEAN